MKMSMRPVGDVAVIDLSGKLDEVGHVDDAIALAAPTRKVLLNFHNVSKVTDTTVRHLKQMTEGLQAQGGQLKVANARISDTTMLTQLTVSVDVYDDEAVAIHNFR